MTHNDYKMPYYGGYGGYYGPRPRRNNAGPRYYARAPQMVTSIPNAGGHGRYRVTRRKPAARTTGKGRATGSRAAARRIGARAGEMVHDTAMNGLLYLKDKIMSMFGSGDYVTGPMPKSNVLMNDAQIPKFSGGRTAVTITHREYLGDLYSSPVAGAFSIQKFSLNPGLPASFPWLSEIAANFQQYRWNGVVYEFRSMSSDALNSVNTALGTVTFSTNYDATDPAFTNKQQMENTEFAVSCKPSVNMMHGIECARSQSTLSELYVRTGAPPTGSDKRMYDMGTTYIATQGCQGTSVNLGEIWVTYSVTFLKAVQLPQGADQYCARYRLLPVNATASVPVNLTGSTVDYDNIGLSNNGGNTLVFPRDIPVGTAFELTWIAYFGASGGPNGPAIYGSTVGITVIPAYANNGASYANSSTVATNTSTAIMQMIFQITSNSSNPSIAFNNYTATNSVSAIDLKITQVSAEAYPLA